MAIRPLRVKELAEVLAVDFDDAEGIPKLKPNWRWEDQEQALLTSCSSLITIVEIGRFTGCAILAFFGQRIPDLGTARYSSGDVSRYHIDLEPAHTILAQACMSVLLQPDDRVEESGVEKSSPLAGYAAQHWVTHAQIRKCRQTQLQKAMEYLFDLDKPYFAAWLQLHDIDIPRPGSSFFRFTPRSKSDAPPLYYAALCGFQDLVEHLIVKYPQHVNTTGGYYVTPLVAALAGGHFQTAKLLRDNGAHVNVRGDGRKLHCILQLTMETRDGSGITRLQGRCQCPERYRRDSVTLYVKAYLGRPQYRSIVGQCRPIIA